MSIIILAVLCSLGATVVIAGAIKIGQRDMSDHPTDFVDTDLHPVEDFLENDK